MSLVTRGIFGPYMTSLNRAPLMCEYRYGVKRFRLFQKIIVRAELSLFMNGGHSEFSKG